VLEGVFQNECGDYQINDAIERFEPLSSLMPASRT
jgi:hypothetical protein